MRKAIILAMLLQGEQSLYEEDFDKKAGYVFDHIDRHPEAHMNELYATIDTALRIEPALVYMVAAQYWQDDFRETHNSYRTQPTQIYNVGISRELATDISDVAASVLEEIEAHPIEHMGALYQGVTVAMRHAPNGVYLYGCKTQEENFTEGMLEMSYALEQMAKHGFSFNEDLDAD